MYYNGFTDSSLVEVKARGALNDELWLQRMTFGYFLRNNTTQHGIITQIFHMHCL